MYSPHSSCSEAKTATVPWSPVAGVGGSTAATGASPDPPLAGSRYG